MCRKKLPNLLQRLGSPSRIVLVCLLMVAHVPAVARERLSSTANAAAAPALLKKLVASLDQMASVDRQIEAAWPFRRQDELNEQPPPLEVRELRAARARLEGKQDLILRQLEETAAEDAAAVLTALGSTERVELIDILTPVATRAAGSTSGVLSALTKAAQRVRPCPPSILNALAAFDDGAAAEVLLDVARRDGQVAAFIAAAKSGDVKTWDRLIRLVVSRSAHSDLVLRALRRVEPRRTRELGDLIRRRAETSRLLDLRTVLITQLGIFARGRDVGALIDIFSTDGRINVRVAVIGALGRCDVESAQDFVLRQLVDSREKEIRRASMFAVARHGDERAIPFLIQLLDDAQLERDATRALQRLTRQTHLRSKAVWQRWWRVQPQNTDDEPDAELDEGRVRTVKLLAPPGTVQLGDATDPNDDPLP